MLNSCIIAASNNRDILHTNLLASPDLVGKETSIQQGAVSAGEAYNRGIDATQAELMIFAHQDMFLPAGWLGKLQRVLEELERTDPHWGVLGMFGVTASGDGHGHLYSTGLQRELGENFEGAREVESLDEIVLVLRRPSGLRFDEGLPGFHLYGADICTLARSRGLKNYAFASFAVHNTNGIPLLPAAYWKCYLHLRAKWRQRLPVMTPCMPITRSPGPALRYLAKRVPRTVLKRIKTGKRTTSQAELQAIVARYISG